MRGVVGVGSVGEQVLSDRVGKHRHRQSLLSLRQVIPLLGNDTGLLEKSGEQQGISLGRSFLIVLPDPRVFRIGIPFYSKSS